MYNFIGGLIFLFLKRISKHQFVNRERLPKTGAYILAGRHTTWMDVVWYGCAALPRNIHFMAKEELFKNPVSSWLFRKINAFPVNRDNPGPSSLKVPGRLLKKGEIFGIFPSGTRENNTALKLGVASIARRGNVPIYPVVYIGPEKFKFKNFFKRPRVILIIGDPIYPRNYLSVESNEKEERIRLLSSLDQKIEELYQTGLTVLSTFDKE